MDPELAWQDLVAAALLGTDRRAFAPPPAAGPLGLVFEGLGGREPEKALLGTAAALATYRRAGRLPEPDPSPLIDPSPVDDRPRCSSGSDGHLALMLSGTHAEVLPEWLGALASSGKRPAEEAMPALLEFGRSRAAIRPAIVEAVGPLGAWLARQNPDWSYAASAVAEIPDDPAIEARWQVGTVLERSTLLARIREADPSKARDLVTSTWDLDDPEARSTFLKAFANRLSLADQPFLEATLGDRRKEVRKAAAELLARLPGSDLVARMVERVAPLLDFSESATRAIVEGLRQGPEPADAPSRPAAPAKPFKDVVPIDVCDKSMVRDGIDPKFSRPGLGEKAGWLYQMIARIPPSAWSRAWGLPPETLAEAAVKCKWREATYPGLLDAAILHGDAEWLDALLPHIHVMGNHFDLDDILDAIPEGRRASTALHLLRSPIGRSKGGENVVWILQAIPGPWDDDLSREALKRLRDQLSTRSRIDSDLCVLLDTLAPRLPPELVLPSTPRRTVDSTLSKYCDQQVDAHLETFLALIQFRHEMLQELRA